MKLPGYDTVAGVIASWFSPTERVRRLKDEKDKLDKERRWLILTKCDGKKAKRMAYLERRIADIDRLLQNYI